MALPVGLRASQEYCASLHGFLSVYTDHGLMVCNPSTEQVFNLTKNTQFVGYDPIGGQHKALSNPVVMCFDVRSEKVSFIQAPSAVVLCGKNAIFIEYNGKLASILLPRSCWGKTHGAAECHGRVPLTLCEPPEQNRESSYK
ncbi:BnaC07g48030D [Brassica napus]|uniref:BnaC07g48030D protein n=1 Tax=Brassica napus TaxID=3708 RepID=A0A078JC87_BRANA|nr:BnaC07g48030D [Brassica napus]